METNGQIVVRYCDASGNVTAEANPNGSLGNIAGICSHGRNVFGLMPHPERASESILGGTDGRGIFQSMIEAVAKLEG
jgi:phosphoribosylformylglycinamidine synthase